MEILASLTVCIGFFGSVGLASLQGFPLLFAVVICLQSVVCLCLENCTAISKKSPLFNIVRPQCGSGVYCAQLVPVAVIMSTYFFNIKNITDPYWVRLAVVCISLSAVSIAVHLGYIESFRRDEANAHGSVIMPLATWFLTMVPVLASLASYNVVFAKEDFLVVVLTAGVAAISQRILLTSSPRSFSLGEAALVAHGFVLLFYTSHSFKTSASNETDFLQIAGFCCFLLVLMAQYIDFLQNSLGFYLITMFIVVSVATPLSLIVLDQHFLLWILQFISQHFHRMYLFLYWGTTCVIAVIIVAYHYVCSSPEQSQVQHASTSVRKIFHLLAVCVYVPGILVDVKMSYVASTCAVIVFIALEVVRKLNVWPMGGLIEESFKVFIDSRDAGPIILTHLYLLGGCTLPLWLGTPSTNMNSTHVALLSAILSLGVGDTAASVFGSRFGSNKWPGTNKTIEGTCAGVVLQVVTVFVLTSCVSIHYSSWIGIFIAIVLTSVVEAFTSQIDNIVLPVFMHTLLLSLQ